ncbi:hypothetical protein CNX72_19810 [Burkholderia pseudomallei]|nr:hypothetical protein CNX72_19810 [Burkholderia pseudomallei]
MKDVVSRYRHMLSELIAQRVPLVCRESANGRYVSITTVSGVHVLTVSREVARSIGIGPHRLSSKQQPIASPRERCITPHQEARMPSIEPVRWAHPDTASDALKPLLERGGGRVENVIVQRWCNPHFPPRHRERYVMAEYVLLNGAGVFIDTVSRRLLYPSGWILARA